jgi:hypothetical protein
MLLQQQQQQAAGQVAGPVAPAAEEPAPPPASPTDVRAQEAEKLPADLRKQARHGLRQLVAALESEPDKTKWQGMILQGLSTNPAIFHYIQVRAIRPAIIEAGANEGLASQIMQMIEESGQVPHNIPRI